jgi:hypothetical protein
VNGRYSTAVRIVVIGTGLIVTVWYVGHQEERRKGGHGPFPRFERDG